ncbi:MAG TPA: ribokinase [Rhodobacteraceae bacterium]|nr:ribokinase [Paracoccaceae bacterium]
MIFNLGSINIDHIYNVPHFPAPGETLLSDSYSKGLGGKGANQSIAIARAGGQVAHIGAIGDDALWTRDILAGDGVDTSGIEVLESATGHAIINVDPSGENCIVLFDGANVLVSEGQISAALAGAKTGDWLLLQNEVNNGPFAAKLARAKGLKVAYVAAPFEAAKVKDMMPFVDLLSVNEGEAAMVCEALGVSEDEIPVEKLLVTHGSDSITYRDGANRYTQDIFEVKPVDTTGAGDTFMGYFMAELDAGKAPQEALRMAAAAAALKVTKKGTAEAIPLLEDVAGFIRSYPPKSS